jgi:hypothetical protein
VLASHGKLTDSPTRKDDALAVYFQRVRAESLYPVGIDAYVAVNPWPSPKNKLKMRWAR